jgi:hypothetical protein
MDSTKTQIFRRNRRGTGQTKVKLASIEGQKVGEKGGYLASFTSHAWYFSAVT